MFVDQQSVDYFRHREQAERTAAKHAQSEAARRVHQQLAQRYADMIHRSKVSEPSEFRR